ncbi:MAG: hypothetical protein WBP58_14345 [Chitinophagaceae bacterium]
MVRRMNWSRLSIYLFFILWVVSCTQPKDAEVQDPVSHLKDSIRVDGDAVVFLVPDSTRFGQLNADPESGALEVDSDHGYAIQQTVDSIRKDALYIGITITVTHTRYIQFVDCVICTPWMDRDSINYGYVMTGPGRKPMMAINTVHGGDYLQEIHEFYGIDSLYGFRKSSLATMFNDAHLFNLTDTIFADFNGDGETDLAYFRKDGKKLQLLVAGKTGVTIIGSHASFAKLGDDFSWASFWALTRDKELEEHMLKGAVRKHPLGPNSIIIQRDEVGGGVVTFKDGAYQWIHLTD